MAWCHAGDRKHGASPVVYVDAFCRNFDDFYGRVALYAGLSVLSRMATGVFFHFVAALQGAKTRVRHVYFFGTCPSSRLDLFSRSLRFGNREILTGCRDYRMLSGLRDVRL